VIDLKNQPITSKSDDTETYTAILVCLNCFTRVLYARPLKTKTQEEVKKQLRSILGQAPHKPQVISTNNGLEFKGEVSEYLESKGIIQRFRSVGDINALGLVDRAIQQLRLKIAEMMAKSETGNLKDVLSYAVNALNDQRRTDVLHGARPEQVRGNPEIRFMLLEDQAENAEHNRNLTAKRVARLAAAGAYREPLPGAGKVFKRGHQATYGEIQHVANIQGSTVTDTTRREIDVKRVKVVPQGTTEAVGRFGEHNDRLMAQKKQEARPIISELEQILDERGPRVSLASAGYEMRQRIADYDAILEKIHMKLIDVIRLVPEHFKLVEREPGKQDWYYVVKA
jgi:hypothetical protein